MVQKLDEGQFYIICPDNESSSTMDKLRIQWGAEDMVNERPALARWHPECEWKVLDEMIFCVRVAWERCRGRLAHAVGVLF